MAFVEIPDTGGDSITALTGDVVATGPGSVASTIQNGVVTSAKLASAVSTDIATGLINNNFLSVLNAISSPYKAVTIGNGYPTTGTLNLADNNIFLTAIWLPVAATITGVTFMLTTTGNYTADNENRIGLYALSGSNLSLVASTANDGNIWKATNNTFVNTPFSSPYVASAGLYWIGALYNQSLQTTAPIMAGSGPNWITAAACRMGSSLKLTGNASGHNTLPSSITNASISNQSQFQWFALYV